MPRVRPQTTNHPSLCVLTYIPFFRFHCLALWNQYLHQRRHPVPDVYSPHTYVLIPAERF